MYAWQVVLVLLSCYFFFALAYAGLLIFCVCEYSVSAVVFVFSMRVIFLPGRARTCIRESSCVEQLKRSSPWAAPRPVFLLSGSSSAFPPVPADALFTCLLVLPLLSPSLSSSCLLSHLTFSLRPSSPSFVLLFFRPPLITSSFICDRVSFPLGPLCFC